MATIWLWSYFYTFLPSIRWQLCYTTAASLPCHRKVGGVRRQDGAAVLADVLGTSQSAARGPVGGQMVRRLSSLEPFDSAAEWWTAALRWWPRLHLSIITTAQITIAGSELSIRDVTGSVLTKTWVSHSTGDSVGSILKKLMQSKCLLQNNPKGGPRRSVSRKNAQLSAVQQYEAGSLVRSHSYPVDTMVVDASAVKSWHKLGECGGDIQHPASSNQGVQVSPLISSLITPQLPTCIRTYLAVSTRYEAWIDI